MRSPNALHLLAAALAGWLNRYQQAIIDYLNEESRIFKQQLSGRRLRLSDDDRRRFATKGKAFDRDTKFTQAFRDACLIPRISDRS